MSLEIPLYEAIQADKLLEEVAKISVQKNLFNYDLSTIKYISYFDSFFESRIFWKINRYYELPQIGIEFFSIGYECGNVWQKKAELDGDELAKHIETIYIEKESFFNKKKTLVSKIKKPSAFANEVEEVVNNQIQQYIKKLDSYERIEPTKWSEEGTQVFQYNKTMFQLGLWSYIRTNGFNLKEREKSYAQVFPYNLGMKNMNEAWDYFLKNILIKSYDTRHGRYIFISYQSIKKDYIIERLSSDLQKNISNNDEYNYAIELLRLSFFAGMLAYLLNEKYNDSKTFYEQEILRNGFFEFEEKTVSNFEKEDGFDFLKMRQTCLELSIKCMMFACNSEEICLSAGDMLSCANIMFDAGQYIADDFRDIRY